MRVLKLVFNAFILFVLLPVSIAVVLGIVFAPLQTSARAVAPRAAFEVNDIMWVAALEVDAGDEPDATPTPEPGPAPEPELQSPDALPAGSGLAAEQPVSPEGASEADSGDHYTSDQLRVQGVINDGDYRYTWYSQRVLPGGGLDIEGRHVSDDGYVVDAQDRVVVASSDLPHGTELDVPFGSGRAVVLDTGCASGTIDVYTDF